MKAALFTCVLVLAPCAMGQTSTPTSTVPAGYLKAAGETRHFRGFYGVSARDMGIYSPRAAGIHAAPRAIVELFVRQDESSSGLAAFTVDVEILMSSKGSQWKTLGSTKFDSNHGTDKKVFFKRAKISFPAATTVHNGPRPWTLAFKGVAPFVAMAKEGLIIDYKVYSNTSNKVLNYADAGRHSPNGRGDSFGTGCPSGFSIRSLDHKVDPTRPWYTYSVNAGGGNLVASWIGLTETKLLIPGTSCHFYTMPLVIHPAVVKANASGYTNQTPWTWGKIPAVSANTVVYTQAASFDAKGKLSLSNGLRVLFGAGFTAPPHYQAVYGYDTPSRAFNPDTSLAHGSSSTSAMIFGVR
jgi:hypothetical protein